MKNNNAKIVFLLAIISQPRCIKRIQSFIDKGFEVEIFGFNRGIYNINSRIQGKIINDLGYAPSGRSYIHKFFNSYIILKKIFNKYKDSDVIYYAFSYDLALLCKLHSGKKYIYEISDLVYAYFKHKLILNIFKNIDKWIIKNSFLTIMTSDGFNSFLFPNSKKENIIIQPNRVNFQLLKTDLHNSFEENSPKIIFSYIGAFRYPNTVFRFAKIIGEKYPHHEFHFWGDSSLTDLAIELSNKYSNIIYNGEFKNPDDLIKIYSSIDVVVACYDTSTLNERIAEPNKLYESLFFKKPIIVSNGTFLSNRVEEYKCGYSIDASNDSCIIDFINTINKKIIKDTINQINTIPISEIVDDNAAGIISYIDANN